MVDHFEMQQVDRAERDAMDAHQNAAIAAASYGEDVVLMLQSGPGQDLFYRLGLIRLYARIAARLAARHLDRVR